MNPHGREGLDRSVSIPVLVYEGLNDVLSIVFLLFLYTVMSKVLTLASNSCKVLQRHHDVYLYLPSSCQGPILRCER